jgi:hypothetical protein
MSNVPLFLNLFFAALLVWIVFTLIVRFANNRGRFTLRTLWLMITIIAVVIGGLTAIYRLRKEARAEAVRQAIRDGRIDGGEFRGWFSAAEFEQLRDGAGSD